MDDSSETSISCDIQGVAPLLGHLADVQGVTLAPEVRAGLAKGIADLPVGATGEWRMPITRNGTDHTVGVRAQMAKPGAPDLHFRGSEAAIAVIDEAMRAFADDAGRRFRA